MDTLTALIGRGLRHLFRLRWEMDLSTGRGKCPCCQGTGGHWLLDPALHLARLGAERGIYQAANVVGCSYCTQGVIVLSENHSYANTKRGQCVTGRR